MLRRLFGLRRQGHHLHDEENPPTSIQQAGADGTSALSPVSLRPDVGPEEEPEDDDGAKAAIFAVRRSQEQVGCCWYYLCRFS
jgi:hypothetical protein